MAAGAMSRPASTDRFEVSGALVVDSPTFIDRIRPPMTEASIEAQTLNRSGSSRPFGALRAALLSLALLPGACSMLPDWTDPTGWFGKGTETGGNAEGDGLVPSEPLSAPMHSGGTPAPTVGPVGEEVAARAAPEGEPGAQSSPPPDELQIEPQAGAAPPATTQGVEPTEPRSVPQPAPQPTESAASDGATAQQTAALPPPTSTLGEARILFAEDSAELSEAAKAQLTSVAEVLLQDETVRIQLLSFAQSPEGDARRARRVSLTRALVVRAFLVDQGLRPARMNLRSLADKIQDGPPDRVDILLHDPSP